MTCLILRSLAYLIVQKKIFISSVHTFRTLITDSVIIVAKFKCFMGSLALRIPTALLLSFDK